MKRRETEIFGCCHQGGKNTFPTRTLVLIFFLFLWCLPVPVSAGEPGTFINPAGILVPVLLLLVASLLAIIAVLVCWICRQKNKLRRSQEYLVRYITGNMELKSRVPGLKEPYHFNPPEITPEEFIKVINNMLKRMLFLSLFVLLAV